MRFFSNPTLVGFSLVAVCLASRPAQASLCGGALDGAINPAALTLLEELHEHELAGFKLFKKAGVDGAPPKFVLYLDFYGAEEAEHYLEQRRLRRALPAFGPEARVDGSVESQARPAAPNLGSLRAVVGGALGPLSMLTSFGSSSVSEDEEGTENKKPHSMRSLVLELAANGSLAKLAKLKSESLRVKKYTYYDDGSLVTVDGNDVLESYVELEGSGGIPEDAHFKFGNEFDQLPTLAESKPRTLTGSPRGAARSSSVALNIRYRLSQAVGLYATYLGWRLWFGGSKKNDDSASEHSDESGLGSSVWQRYKSESMANRIIDITGVSAILLELGWKSLDWALGRFAASAPPRVPWLAPSSHRAQLTHTDFTQNVLAFIDSSKGGVVLVTGAGRDFLTQIIDAHGFTVIAQEEKEEDDGN